MFVRMCIRIYIYLYIYMYTLDDLSTPVCLLHSSGKDSLWRDDARRERRAPRIGRHISIQHIHKLTHIYIHISIYGDLQTN